MALGAPWAATAQSAGDSTWSLTGSYFNLYTQSRTVVPPVRRFILDVGRARLKLVGAPFERIGIEVQYDNEVLLGDYVRTTQYALVKDRVETTFDLQRDYAAGGDLVARHGLYRAIVTWSGRSTDVKMGRQRIALGTGFFWSPMDLLNPLDPTRLERDYRTGADAVVVEQRLGAIGRAAGMYVPSSDRVKSVGAAYLHGNVRGADYSVIVGHFRGDDAVGADFSSSVEGLGLRAEATATRPATGNRYARALVGADYGFANSAKLTAEVYYNGRGASVASRYDLPGLLAGRVLSLARWYGAVAATYDVTPLIKLSTYGVVNADDGSLVLWPRLEWSAKTDVDLAIGWQRFSGGARSEYGRLSDLLHLEARWFF
jgi:hypothetical protein